jgi:hypothetical protein
MANMRGISIFSLLVVSAACLVAVKGDVVELTDSTFTDKVRASALSSNLCGFLQFPSVLCVFLAFFSSWILAAGKRKRGETVIDKISVSEVCV